MALVFTVRCKVTAASLTADVRLSAAAGGSSRDARGCSSKYDVPSKEGM